MSTKVWLIARLKQGEYIGNIDGKVPYLNFFPSARDSSEVADYKTGQTLQLQGWMWKPLCISSTLEMKRACVALCIICPDKFKKVKEKLKLIKSVRGGLKDRNGSMKIQRRKQESGHPLLLSPSSTGPWSWTIIDIPRHYFSHHCRFPANSLSPSWLGTLRDKLHLAKVLWGKLRLKRATDAMHLCE